MLSLKQARCKAGLSQGQLASKISGIDQGTVSALESGARPLGPRVAAKLAAALNTDATALIVQNQEAVFRRAIHNKNAKGAIGACKSILSAAETLSGTQADREALHSLVHTVVAFAERRSSGHEDVERYGVISG